MQRLKAVYIFSFILFTKEYFINTVSKIPKWPNTIKGFNSWIPIIRSSELLEILLVAKRIRTRTTPISYSKKMPFELSHKNIFFFFFSVIFTFLPWEAKWNVSKTSSESNNLVIPKSKTSYFYQIQNQKNKNTHTHTKHHLVILALKDHAFISLNSHKTQKHVKKNKNKNQPFSWKSFRF